MEIWILIELYIFSFLTERLDNQMSNIKILILGASGMLGHKLFSCFSRLPDYEVYGTCREQTTLQQLFPELTPNIFGGLDITKLKAVTKIIKRLNPDIIINCIGIIKQKLEALQPVKSIYVNGLFPHLISLICQDINARMIHISTDCVFDGEDGNYTETSIPNCVDLYGRSKLLGEVDYPHCLTIRTSIIGHELKSKLGLMEWFLAQEGSIQGYTCHIYSGVTTVELAKVIATYVIPDSQINGIYQVSAEPISKYELLKLVALQYGKHINIEPFDTAKCDRSLNSNKFRRLTGYTPTPWPELIYQMYIDYINTPYPNNE